MYGWLDDQVVRVLQVGFKALAGAPAEWRRLFPAYLPDAERDALHALTGKVTCAVANMHGTDVRPPLITVDDGAVGEWGGVPILDLLHGTFWHARQIVEFFPSLEPVRGTDAIGHLTAEAKRLAPMTTIGPALDRSNLATAVKAHLTLVYRIVPWRAAPLSGAVGSASGAAGAAGGIVGAVTQALGIDGATDIDPTMFGGETGSKLPKHVVSPGEVIAYSADQNDDARINAATADPYMVGTHHFTLMQQMGLPLMDRLSVERHGLRLYASTTRSGRSCRARRRRSAPRCAPSPPRRRSSCSGPSASTSAASPSTTCAATSATARRSASRCTRPRS